MQNNNNHKSNSACTFGETLVSVLYGEATPDEVADFENHLKQCRECAGEFVSFGSLRNAVSEWRATEFAPLASPNIDLSDEIRTIELKQSGRNSWLESVRAFFIHANFGWQATGACFAGLIILGLFFIGSTGLFMPPEEVSQSNLPVLNPTPEIAAVSNSERERNETKVVLDEPTINNPAENKDNNQSQSTRTSRKPQKQSVISPTRSKKLQPSRNATRKIEPKDEGLTLPSVADAEDNSPRLTDLFDEIEPST